MACNVWRWRAIQEKDKRGRKSIVPISQSDVIQFSERQCAQ